MARKTLAAAISAIAIGVLAGCQAAGSANGSGAMGGAGSVSGSGRVSSDTGHPLGATYSEPMGQQGRGDRWSR
jgi:hypothetical protein